ncbi:MAG: hypothetical protein L0Y79_04590 [Chlorobi bacterium]|nr:hypothetical protein [Chlorobiota bacterium]MCI0716774.1 hypothetical protein [Chlorobiota bacterium]
MKKSKILNGLFLNFLFVLLSIMLLFSCGKKDEGTTSGDKKESTSDDKTSEDKLSETSPIYVQFEISGSTKGTVDGYYHNKKAKTMSQMETGGMKISATAYFDGGEYVHIISEVAGKKMGMKYKRDDFGKKEGEFDAVTFKDQLKNMDKIGQEEILGKKCDIYKAKDGSYQISIYKELVPLKFSGKDGKMVMVAKKFETDANFSDDIFTPPSDVDYMDAGNLMKDMKDMKNMKDKVKGLEDKTKEMEDMMKKYKK